MIDETRITQGQHIIAGCPWHGTVRGSRLWISPTRYRDGLFSAESVRGSLRCAVPGIAAVMRTPEQLVADAASGISWRSDAALVLKDRGDAYLYGFVQIYGHSLYAVAPGKVFVFKLPDSQTVNAGRSELVDSATATRFGRASYAPVTEVAQVRVTLSGYEASNPSYQSIIDMLPDGSMSIVGGVSFDNDLQAYVPPWPLLGFGLLKIAGTGDPGSQITAELQQLSGSNEFASSERTNEDPEAPTAWDTEISIEWLDDPDSNGDDSLCKMSYARVVRGFMSPINQTQTRSARLSGYIAGWWFNDLGVVQAITLDISYSRTITTVAAAEGIGNPPQIFKQRYFYQSSIPGCLPNGGAVLINEVGESPYSYDWNAESVRTTVEDFEVVLRVGGTEVDRTLTRYEHQCAYTVASTSRYLATPPGAVYTSSERLLLNGEEIDSRVFPTETNLFFGIGASKTVLDPTSLFSSIEPAEFLLGMLDRESSLGAGRAVISRKLHWFSSTLVCIRERVLEHKGGTAILNRYGFAAHPGGVTTAKINSLAMLGKNPRRIYGSRNPLTGEVLLGETDQVTHV